MESEKYIEPTSILENQYKRLLEQIDEVWGYPEQFENVMSKILLDDRGDRAGFPMEIWTELNYLQALHKKVYQRNVADNSGGARKGKNF